MLEVSPPRLSVIRLFVFVFLPSISLLLRRPSINESHPIIIYDTAFNDVTQLGVTEMLAEIQNAPSLVTRRSS